MLNNVLLIDSDYDEATPFIQGLKEATGEEWDITMEQNNKIYGVKRYAKFFTVAFKMFLKRKKYVGKTLLCWQQFYGITIAFFCRLFHVRKCFNLVIMTFIYKPKFGLTGKLFNSFIKYAITSQYVDKIILTTNSERKLYVKEFGVDENLFAFAHCGAVEFDPVQFEDADLRNQNYYFSTGRSNRDYQFLIDSFKGTNKKLVIACDSLKPECNENIEIRDDLFGNDMLRYMRNAQAVIISLANDCIAAGQLVFLHAMNMGTPAIITKSKGITDDYVKDGYNGLIIEKKKEDLLKAINKLENQNFRCFLSENSMKEFKDKYTYYSSGKEIGSILNQLY